MVSLRRNSLPIPLTPLGQPIREHWWKLQQISGERRCWLWPCVLSSIPSSQRELEKNTEGLEVNREQWYLRAIRPQRAISSLNNVDATGMSVSMKLLETTDSLKWYRHMYNYIKGKKKANLTSQTCCFNVYFDHVKLVKSLSNMIYLYVSQLFVVIVQIPNRWMIQGMLLRSV